MTKEKINQVMNLTQTKKELETFIEKSGNRPLQFTIAPGPYALAFGNMREILNRYQNQMVHDLELSLNDINRQIEEL